MDRREGPVANGEAEKGGIAFCGDALRARLPGGRERGSFRILASLGEEAARTEKLPTALRSDGERRGAGEIQPLLHLMESAEKRDALKKSLRYLEEAEELDRVNPAVRRAKARLLVSSALRHLRQHKTHLVPAEIEPLLSVPEVRQGEVSALAAALRWCCAVIDGEQELGRNTKRTDRRNRASGGRIC